MSAPILERLPPWLHRPLGKATEISTVQRLLHQYQIHTICEEGRCPNRGECYSQKTATFLLMGPVCTRSCAFCQVEKGLPPQAIDPREPEKIAAAVATLGLRYVVLTAVARDDLWDQGAGQFVATMAALHRLDPDIGIEVLTPDFRSHKNGRGLSQRDCVAMILAEAPTCYNHNLETVARLQGKVRRGATYESSLNVLALVKQLNGAMPTKSGLMLGLGETEAEIIQTLADLRAVGCDRLTLGQYLRPSLAHLPVQKYWHPDEFERLGAIASEMGFQQVRSGPLVRSSYHASES